MEKQVTLEKIVDASPDRVWKAWTDPQELKRWWGPNNVSIPECTIDLRVGGEFYIVMEAGEGMGEYKGTKWPMRAAFTAVVPNAKLSYTSQAWTEGHDEATMIDQTTDITFAEVRGPDASVGTGKTKVTVVATIHKTGPEAGMAVQGMQAGFTQQLEKLAAFLTAQH